MKFQPLRVSMVVSTAGRSRFMAREPKKHQKRRRSLLEHLAQKVAVLLDTERAHGGTVAQAMTSWICSYDMGNH